MPTEMNNPCPNCGENRWLFHGEHEITEMKAIPADLMEKHEKGEIKIDFEEYRLGFVKTSAFTCKSCGYTFMKDEKGNSYPWKYTDIEK